MKLARNYKVHFDSVANIREYKGKFYSQEWPSISELFALSVHKFADNKFLEAFSPDYFSMTYSQAYEFASRLAVKIKDLGLGRGDKIAVSGKNSPYWALAYLAVQLSGCIAVPLDALLTDEEIVNLVSYADVRMAFVDAQRSSAFSQAGVENLICLDEEVDEDCANIKTWADDVDCTGFSLPEVDIDDVAEILFTSGTTGTPKGVMLTHRNLVSDIFYTNNSMPAYPDDKFYLILPIHHAYAMMAAFLIPIACGSTIVFGRHMVASEILKDLKSAGITIFLGVPALFNKLVLRLMSGVKKKNRLFYIFFRLAIRPFTAIWSLTGVNLSKKVFGFLTEYIGFENMRICISGAGALPASTVLQFRQLGVPFVEGYGMTETSPISTLNPLEGYKFGSVGRVFPELEFKFKDVDENGNGTLCIKGTTVMKGYYKNPEATAEVIDEDGFMNTGDVGHVDKDNYFYITGRAKNIIVTDGGKNVFPEEIEDKFQLYTDVIESIIIAPYKDENGDEKIRAICYPAQSLRESNNDDVIFENVKETVSKVNKKLQTYKKISKIQISPQPFEMTTTKKPKRDAIIKRIDANAV